MRGLTQEEVQSRIKNKQYNYNTEIKTNSISDILKRNLLTYFNIIHLILFVLVLLIGSIKNTLFIIAVIINACISIIQDIRSKKAIDKLSFISKTKNTVIRDNKEVLLDNEEIVLNDIIKLKQGSQVIVDSIIIEGSVEVNEAFITGEELPVYKKKGDHLLSGSFITSGECITEVEHVGNDNYQAKISIEAKYFKKANSLILNTLNNIIKYISIILLPIGILFYLNQHYLVGSNTNVAILNTVASLITMIPEGLVLLTSTVLAVSVIRLSKLNILVQDLYCIETLARVDTICFDKTGTLTTGNMKVIKEIPLNSNYNMKTILSEISYCNKDDNATMKAIESYYKPTNNYTVEKIVPFSSEKKYSAYYFKEGAYILGSPENINNKTYPEYENYRVLLLGSIKNNLIEEIGLIIIEDEIRKESKETINYFKNQSCDIKIISGDNAKTVYNISKRLGISFDKYVDTTNMSENDIEKIAEEYSIFGRVTPQGKKTLIKSLQNKGHIVAMIGDGVNDVLALKEADCSISIKNGSTAARNISKIILVDNNFDHMKNIVAEGRKTINNIEKSASLFIVKTIYSIILATLFIFIPIKYPFIPIQLSLISGLTIGIPSIVLALEPNYQPISKDFFKNIIYKALPTSLSIVINVIYLVIISNLLNYDTIRTASIGIMIIAINSFLHVNKISKPYNTIKKLLIIGLIILFMGSYFIIGDFFSFEKFSFSLLIPAYLLCLNSYIIFNFMTNIFDEK